MRSLVLTIELHRNSWCIKNLYNSSIVSLLPIFITLRIKNLVERHLRIKEHSQPFVSKNFDIQQIWVYTKHIRNFFLYFIVLSKRDQKVPFPTMWWTIPPTVLILGVPLASIMFIRSLRILVTCLKPPLSTNQSEVLEY
jgi:hypothetical protein